MRIKNKNLTAIGIVIAISAILLSYQGFQNQKENNKLQTELALNEKVNNKINIALDLISEGESIQDELANRVLNGESILKEEKETSFNLIKAGLDSLENIKLKYNNTEAVKHLIRFYLQNNRSPHKVQELRNEMLNYKKN